MADYPELSGVSEVYTRGLLSSCADILLRRQYLRVPCTYSNVGLQSGPLDRSLQEYQGNDRVGYAPQGVVPGPTQATLPGPWAHRAPVLTQPAAENLRRLASRCVHHPDSQVDVVRMEPCTSGRYKVVIALEMADLL